MSWEADPAGQQDRPDPDDQAGPAEEVYPADDEVYSADEEDQIAARLQALGYLD